MRFRFSIFRFRVLLLAGFALCVSCKSTQDLGNEALRVGDYDRAVKMFSQALDGSPSDRDARYGLALAYFGKAEAAEKIGIHSLELWTESQAEFRILSKIDSSAAREMHSMSLFYLARAEIAADPHARVLPVLDESLSLDSLNSFALNLKALVLQGMGESEEAKRIFTSILSRDPGFAPAYSNLGNLYWQMGKIDDAWDVWSLGTLQFPRNARLKFWTKVAEDSLKSMALGPGTSQ